MLEPCGKFNVNAHTLTHMSPHQCESISQQMQQATNLTCCRRRGAVPTAQMALAGTRHHPETLLLLAAELTSHLTPPSRGTSTKERVLAKYRVMWKSTNIQNIHVEWGRGRQDDGGEGTPNLGMGVTPKEDKLCGLLSVGCRQLRETERCVSDRMRNRVPPLSLFYICRSLDASVFCFFVFFASQYIMVSRRQFLTDCRTLRKLVPTGKFHKSPQNALISPMWSTNK